MATEILAERDVALCKGCSRPFDFTSPNRVVKHTSNAFFHEKCYQSVFSKLFKMRENLFGAKVWSSLSGDQRDRLQRAIYTAAYLDEVAKCMPHCNYHLINLEHPTLTPCEINVATADKWCADLSDTTKTAAYCIQVPPKFWGEAYAVIDIEMLTATTKKHVQVDLVALAVEWIKEENPEEKIYLVAQSDKRIRLIVRCQEDEDEKQVPPSLLSFQLLGSSHPPPIKTRLAERAIELANRFKLHYSRPRLRTLVDKELCIVVLPRIVSRADVWIVSQYEGMCRLLVDRQMVPAGFTENVYAFSSVDEKKLYRVKKQNATVPFVICDTIPESCVEECPTQYVHTK